MSVVATTYPSGVAEWALRKGKGSPDCSFVDKALMRKAEAPCKSQADFVVFDRGMGTAGIGSTELSSASFDVVTSKAGAEDGVALYELGGGALVHMQMCFEKGLFAGGACGRCTVVAGPCGACSASLASMEPALCWKFSVVDSDVRARSRSEVLAWNVASEALCPWFS